MDEKVIYEMRFIKTEDGFRVEVKGDKDQMREFAWGRGMRRQARRWAREARHCNPRHWGSWWDDDEPEEKPKAAPEPGATSV